MYRLTIRIRSDDTIRPNTNTLFGIEVNIWYIPNNNDIAIERNGKLKVDIAVCCSDNEENAWRGRKVAGPSRDCCQVSDAELRDEQRSDSGGVGQAECGSRQRRTAVFGLGLCSCRTRHGERTHQRSFRFWGSCFLVIHHWVGDVQDSLGVFASEMTYYCVVWGAKLYSLTQTDSLFHFSLVLSGLHH